MSSVIFIDYIITDDHSFTLAIIKQLSPITLKSDGFDFTNSSYSYLV